MPRVELSALHLALRTVPPWFTVASSSAAGFTGTARLGLNSADGDITTALDIETDGSGLRTREGDGGTLPTWCPERHINWDGWFCLGLQSGAVVTDAASAAAWWDSLAAFLRTQRVAARTGLWPEHHALSHGAAGEHHHRALAGAERLGLSEEYERLVLGEATWLATLLGVLAEGGSRLINGRARCTCPWCRHTGRLRRKCPKRVELVELLADERARRHEVASYWAKMKGQACCGTMRSCPLAVR